MRILHVMPSYVPAYGYGGSVKGIHDLCRMLVKKGHYVEVVTTNIDGKKLLDVCLCKAKNIDGVKVTYYPVKFLKKYCYSPFFSKVLKLKVKDFDLVHIHSVFLYPTFVASYWCRRMSVPYLINPFGALDFDMISLKSSFLKRLYIRFIESYNIKGSVAVQVASEYEKERFLEFGFSVPVAVLQLGLLLEEYDRTLAGEELEKVYPQLKGKKVILFLSRIHPKKGLENLALAFKELVSKKKDIFLLIAGTGQESYVQKIKSFLDNLDLSNQVIFTGMLLGQEKLSAFYGSDIFVLPSYGENFGIAVLESMACGLPQVVSDRVGLCRYVKKYETGVVTAGNHPAKIAAALQKLLDDGKKREIMGEKGQKLVQDMFTTDKIIAETIRLYRWAIQ